MTEKVFHCGDCPFCNNDFEQGESCNAPDAAENTSWPEIPDDCPLRNGAITVYLAETGLGSLDNH